MSVMNWVSVDIIKEWMYITWYIQITHPHPPLYFSYLPTDARSEDNRNSGNNYPNYSDYGLFLLDIYFIIFGYYYWTEFYIGLFWVILDLMDLTSYQFGFTNLT